MTCSDAMTATNRYIITKQSITELKVFGNSDTNYLDIKMTPDMR